ncbi:MAG: ATP-grasp domain-containing protein [Treponema sp.]|jgi:biotin carboxylase|nr:ATP-grasp domain-containing protein [Treponema sp.]
MKETLIILGAGVMQEPAIRIAKELGYFTVVLDGSKEAPCVSLADRFEQIDLKDKEGIETFARSLQNTSSRLGVMTAGTDFSASVAWTAEKLGLPGIPYEAALNASDKGRMRECFRKTALPSPDFVTITAEDSLDIALPFPLVIKPVDNMGSRGCRRVDSADELQEAAKTAIGFSRSGRAIVESYMDGPEFSVDAIFYHGEITICGLADRHIFFPPYFIEMGHTMPTIIDVSKQEEMLETFRAGIRALGLAGVNQIGAAKGDIKLTTNGPDSKAMIGEIAARLSGGYMSGWTYPYSSGAQPIRAAILAAMGKKPDGLIPVKTWTCAERAFISIPGTVKSIIGIERAQTLPHVNDLFLRIQESSKVSFPENNVTKCGNIIASASDRQTAIDAAETAARSILIKLDPKDCETEKFLRNYLISKNSTTEHTEFHGEMETSFTKTPCNSVISVVNPIFKTPSQKTEEDFGLGTGELLTSHFSFPPNAFQIFDEIKKALLELPEYSPTPYSPLPTPHIHPFPAFTSSDLRDYMGRTIQESLDAVRLLAGLSLPLADDNAEKTGTVLGRSFWEALIRGGYQGAVYFIERGMMAG